MRIGIDLGGVVIESDGPDTFFGPDYLRVQPVTQAFESLQYLSSIHTLFVVSKCGAKVEAKSREWLGHWGFECLTDIPYERWHFVRKRADKSPLAVALELNAFVDDRQDVLDHMPDSIQKVLFTSWKTTLSELS